MKIQTVAIIGGGASGIVAALSAAAVPGCRVILFERQQRIGRKLLATGNGRCNLTNRAAAAACYHCSAPGFPVPALSAFGPEQTLAFYRELGLLTVTEPGGRVYPFSDSANSVLDVLRFALDRAGVEQRCSSPVKEVRPSGTGFLVRCEEGAFQADKVILACGGAAGANLGGVMDGYRLAEMLGHKRTKLSPSLTRILTDPSYPRSLKGIRTQAELRLTHGARVIGAIAGEIQFTESGISGPAAFDLSRFISGDGDLLHLKLLPGSEEEIISLLRKRQQQFPDLEASELFIGMLHNRLGRVIVKAAGLAGSLSSLQDADLRRAAHLVSDFTLPVRGTEGFGTAQVTAGGLDTRFFDARTLESRLCPGLFACGELLDVDGPCGGYNLQWAWASGILAGKLGTDPAVIEKG